MQAYDQFKRLLYTEEDSLVEGLNNNVLQHLPVICRDFLEVCDIGGGDGRRIIRILRFLYEKFALRFRLDFVEQSPCLMRAFDVDQIADCVDVREFEMLFEDAELRGGYDLVFVIHSMFAFQDTAAVDKILSLPNSHGIVIAVSNAPNSFVAGLKKLFDADYEDRRFEITDLVKTLEDRNQAFQTIPFVTRWAIGSRRQQNPSRIFSRARLSSYPRQTASAGSQGTSLMGTGSKTLRSSDIANRCAIRD
jgi:hypothetical protein